MNRWEIEAEMEILIKNQTDGIGSRRQDTKTWSSSSPTDTSKTHIRVEQFPQLWNNSS